jgi:hypothetical protein
MSFLHQLWLRLTSPFPVSAPSIPVDINSLDRDGFTADSGDGFDSRFAPKPELKVAGATFAATGVPKWRPFYVSQWFLNDILFVAMLSMAVVGLVLRLPAVYWVVMTPIFGVISIAEGWKHFNTRGDRVGFALRVAAIWCATLLCIFLLYDSSVQGVLNANASSLAMMTLVALGTFAAGIQARVWQICGVGTLLFLAVPGVGWLDQSPLLLTAVALAIVLLAGLVWWVKQLQSSPEAEETPAPVVDAGGQLNASRRSA